MKVVSFQYFLLPAFLAFNKVAFASKGLRTNIDDAPKDDVSAKDDVESRKLIFDLFGEFADEVFGNESFLPNQLAFLSEIFSLNVPGKRAEYCHVKGWGTCKVDQSDVCEMKAEGQCTIGIPDTTDFGRCRVEVKARCDTDAETCTIVSEGASKCDVDGISADASARASFDGTPAPDGTAFASTGTGAGATAGDESCEAETAGEVTCEFKHGKCELNMDKVCAVWLDANKDED